MAAEDESPSYGVILPMRPAQVARPMLQAIVDGLVIQIVV